MQLTLTLPVLCAIPLAPLFGSAIAGFFGTKLGGNRIGNGACQFVTILGVMIAFVLSCFVLVQVMDGFYFNGTVYRWMQLGELNLDIGFLIDPLTATMMCVVTFVSLMVHIYTIGYMQGE